jgi:hypothetical protein
MLFTITFAVVGMLILIKIVGASVGTMVEYTSCLGERQPPAPKYCRWY